MELWTFKPIAGAKKITKVAQLKAALKVKTIIKAAEKKPWSLLMRQKPEKSAN